MPTSRAFWIGAIGTLVTAICCFTPALVVPLGLMGLSGLVGYLDFVLLPLLGLFVLMLVFATILHVRS